MWLINCCWVWCLLYAYVIAIYRESSTVAALNTTSRTYMFLQETFHADNSSNK
ncbi:hypothetical protein BDZ94DRAFT_1247889 [Collybia nuda]|uniref:Uncharacterized protein n=1 Tax=Collybia nuda TaxID=64659 RepID=A0A9P5YD91_9AGAR|nr:hypothetical protein BDZ94DRAFT_1247889 [Collybia nuda]